MSPQDLLADPSGRWLFGNPWIFSPPGRRWGSSCRRCLPPGTDLHLAGRQGYGRAMDTPTTSAELGCSSPVSSEAHGPPQEGPQPHVRLLRRGQQGWGRAPSTKNSCQGAKIFSASSPNLLWHRACPQPLELPGSRSRAMWSPDPCHRGMKGSVSWEREIPPQAVVPGVSVPLD